MGTGSRIAVGQLAGTVLGERHDLDPDPDLSRSLGLSVGRIGADEAAIKVVQMGGERLLLGKMKK